MTLPEFLSKAGALLGFVEKAEKNLVAEGKLSEANKAIADLQLANASLTAELARIKTDLAGQVETIKGLEAKHKDALEAKEKEVETRASAKALEITAAQGRPPLPEVPVTGPQAAAETYESVQAALANEKDPIKAAELGRKCRELRGHQNLFGLKN